MGWVTTSPPVGETFSIIALEEIWTAGQRGAYTNAASGGATRIGTRGAKTALSGGWTLLEKPARGYAFEDDGDYYWRDDNGYNWIREDEWAIIAKPTD